MFSGRRAESGSKRSSYRRLGDYFGLSTSSLKETFMAPFGATVIAVTNGVAEILPVESFFLCKGGKSSSGDSMSKGIEFSFL
ncbi:uncharacterized protein G2W53_029096 [Senna tora]|uniref:Uncharacterized protein n=1 Tax=Senna tora TaxID=362788 RepID=A0A834T4J9_9FABA|nr:uncharacterized protein G2W53_029096 [Senna tora]